ncbi:MAG TPA: single-stranded DNA-binding protein [Bacteroidia bacterium]|nr:single-stranded DNA-binding protein [Bacteroidia bacterium]
MKASKNNHVKMYVCLGTQPVVKTARNGNRMANFFAMDTSAKNAQPENTPLCKWFRVITWGKVADTASRHLHKGKQVLLMGNVVTQQFKTRKGEIRTKQIIVASNIVLLDSGSNVQHAA